MRSFGIILLSLACVRLGFGAPAAAIDLSEFFGGREGWFTEVILEKLAI